jgi:hypothetical protein
MSTVTVTIAVAASQFPASTTTSGTVVTLVAPAGATVIPPQTLAVGVDTATFANVQDGTGYTVTAQALDGAGASLGAQIVSAPFDVLAPKVEIAIPQTITVTVS